MKRWLNKKKLHLSKFLSNVCIKINKTEKSIVYNIFTFTVKHARAKSLGTKDNKRGMIQQTNDFRGRNYPDFPSNSGLF
jgi:hypothetical protein